MKYRSTLPHHHEDCPLCIRGQCPDLRRYLDESRNGNTLPAKDDPYYDASPDLVPLEATVAFTVLLMIAFIAAFIYFVVY